MIAQASICLYRSIGWISRLRCGLLAVVLHFPAMSLPAHAAVMQGLQQHAEAGPSAACRAVSYALDSLQMQHSCHAVIPGCSLVADILLPQLNIVLLVEGRSGYVVNTGKRRGVQHASALLLAVRVLTKVVCR